MNSRLLPSASIIIALAAIAGLLVATVGASSDGTKSRQSEGGDVSAACVEGTRGCNDTIDGPVVGTDGPSNMCIEGATDCNDTIGVNPSCAVDPDCIDYHNVASPADPGVYGIGVGFNIADFRDGDTDAIEQIILSYDPTANFLYEESYPPTLSAFVHNQKPDFCDAITPQIQSVHAVVDVSCAPSIDGPVNNPGDPVSNEPSDGEDIPNSSDLVAPDDCSLVHNVDVCSSPGYDPGAVPQVDPTR